MKKIISSILIILFVNMSASASYIDKQMKNTKHNSKYYNSQHYENIAIKDIYTTNDNIKDPSLIKLSNVKPVNSKLYSNKIKSDEEIYKTKIEPEIYKRTNTINVNPESADFYKLYRITERIIRANNLSYITWRIAINKSEDANASSYEGNYIKINTALYDTLNDNDDALAFVIAHEMAHHILEHQQRYVDLKKRYNIYNCIMAATLVPYYLGGTLITAKKLSNQEKAMEYAADTEAFQLISRAGYNIENALETLKYLESLPNVKDFLATHPFPKERIENIKENAIYIDSQWVEEGRYNIYNSNVLTCKKSSDRVSLIINTGKIKGDFYTPESVEQFITRIAYISYKKGLMENAAKYFAKLAKYKQDYISYLYLSYANQYLYNKTKNEKHLKRAVNAIIKAKDKAPKDKYVNEQYNELNANAYL